VVLRAINKTITLLTIINTIVAMRIMIWFKVCQMSLQIAV